MTWLTSLPAAVLVVGGLALALLVVIGGRLAVRALVPAAERDAATLSRRRSCRRCARSTEALCTSHP